MRLSIGRVVMMHVGMIWRSFLVFVRGVGLALLGSFVVCCSELVVGLWGCSCGVC